MAEQNKTSNPLQTALIGLLVIAAFLIGSLWTKVKTLENGTTVAKNQVPTGAAGQVAGEAAAKPQPVKPALDQVKALFTKDNVAFGDANRKVLFVEFSDPSCPWCHVAGGKNPEIAKQYLDNRYESYVAAVPEMRKLIDQGRASYVWLYRSGHGNGELAAQVLYCANDVDQFWTTHDLLMTNKGYDIMNNVVHNDITKLPEIMKLLNGVQNNSEIQKCVEGGKYKDRLAKDTATGDQLGAGGTPHFIVNTAVYAGAESYANIKTVVDKALQ